MATPEDIEIAKVARDVQIKREKEALESANPPEAMALTGTQEPNIFPSGGNYGVNEADLTYSPDETMVIEGRLPDLVPVSEAEAPNYDWQLPTQAETDAMVTEVAGDQTPYYGPMSRDTLEAPDYGIDAFDPSIASQYAPPETFADQAIPFEEKTPATELAKAPKVDDSKEQARRSIAIMKHGLTGYDRIVQAEKANAVLLMKQGREAAIVQQGYQQQTEEQNTKRLLELQQQEAQTKAKVEEIQKSYEDIGDFKPDRGNWWNSRTTGQKIAAAISLMISGYQHGKAGRGGAPPMLSMMMKAIDDDIADQKSEYMGKRGKAADKKSMFALMMKKFGNEKDAHAATQSIYLNQLQNKIGGIATKYSGTQAGINAEKTIGDIEVKKSQNAAKLYDERLVRKIKERKLVRDEETHSTDQGGYRVPLFSKDGKQLKARTKAMATEVTQAFADDNHNRKTIDAMILKIKAYGLGDLIQPSEIKADLHAMSSILKGSLRVPILGPGTVQAYEREILDSLIGDTGALTGPGKKAAIFRLRALQRESTSKFNENTKAKVSGFVPIETRIGFEPIPKKKRK
jgi:hypothetical protein